MGLKVVPSGIGEVLVLEPSVYADDRGSFQELFNASVFEAATGIRRTWPQDNHSRSMRGVLRGIHYQLGSPQGKLVSCIAGEIFDVAIDLRRASPTFGEWTAEMLSGANGRQLWIPEGFGHGFLVMSNVADVIYKVTAPYDPGGDRSIVWDDGDLSIDWPLATAPVLSEKDRTAPRLSEAEVFV